MNVRGHGMMQKPHNFIVVVGKEIYSKRDASKHLGTYCSIEYDNTAIKTPTGRWTNRKEDRDAMMRRPDSTLQSYPNLLKHANVYVDSNGKQRQSWDIFVEAGQMQKITDVGKKVYSADEYGKKHLCVGVNAYLTFAKDDKGLMLDTSKPMSATRNIFFDSNVLKNQREATKEIRSYVSARRANRQLAKMPSVDMETDKEAEF